MKDDQGDFLNDAVDKSPPANAGDTGLIPGLGRFHITWSSWSPWAITAEPTLWSPEATTAEACAPGTCAPQRKRPLQWESCAPRHRVAPTAGSIKDPKINEQADKVKDNQKCKKQRTVLGLGSGRGDFREGPMSYGSNSTHIFCSPEFYSDFIFLIEV